MKSSSLRSWFALVVGLCLSLTTLVTLSPRAAGDDVHSVAKPSLELVVGDHSVTAFKFRKQPAKLDADISVLATRAPLEFLLKRPRYDEPIRISQMVGGDRVRLPDDTLHGWDGFADFFELKAKNKTGELVYKDTQRFCPSAEERQQVAPGGPAEAVYTLGCQANEFTKGMIWGIEKGWAADAFGDWGARIDVPTGRYAVTIRITRRYRELFDISKAAATVRLNVTVEKIPTCFDCEYDPPAPGNEPVPGDPVPDTTTPGNSVLPDLAPLPPYGIHVFEEPDDRSFLGFASHVWVSGNSDLVVEGYFNETTQQMDAYQYFFNDGLAVSRANVGTFAYDVRDGHDHWHLDRFSIYRFIDAANGAVITSEKQGFCLGPSSPTDLTIPGAVLQDVKPQYETTCGTPESTWIREVVPLGWGDTYHQMLPGQSFEITNVPNGKYFIEIEANPEQFIFERDLGDNLIRRKVVLRGGPNNRRVDFGPVR